jgi:hypothetical protein
MSPNPCAHPLRLGDGPRTVLPRPMHPSRRAHSPRRNTRTMHRFSLSPVTRHIRPRRR